MLALISFFGFLLLLFAVFGYLFRNRLNRFTFLSFLQSKRLMMYLIVAGSFLSLFNQLFFYSRFGHQYYLVYPTGG